MEYVLDERGERVPLIDPETGRQKTDKRPQAVEAHERVP